MEVLIRVSSSRVVRAFAVNLAARAIAHSSEYNFGFSRFVCSVVIKMLKSLIPNLSDFQVILGL